MLFLDLAVETGHKTLLSVGKNIILKKGKGSNILSNIFYYIVSSISYHLSRRVTIPQQNTIRPKSQRKFLPNQVSPFNILFSSNYGWLQGPKRKELDLFLGL
jgi:hypothetical protein